MSLTTACGKTDKLIRMRIVFLLLALSAATAFGQTGPDVSAGAEEIGSLIRDLGDPSYNVRTDATRRLCAIGMPAAERLREAAEGDDAERALRARAVLTALERVFFAGTDMTLSFTKGKIAWDEPVDLRLTMHNKSPYPARIPFELDPERRTDSTEDAAQVGAMLDVADWLKVLGPDGGAVDLRVDDIMADKAVSGAVDQRAREIVVSVLAPGESRTLTIPAFNRGWSRYPLLDAGTYSTDFEYTPAWEDEVLAEQRAGRVTSNRASLEVMAGAPPAVARGRREVLLTLEQHGPVLVATLINTADQPMIVNMNLGGAAPYADAQWVYERNQTRYEIPVRDDKVTGWRQFDAAKLIEVGPGQSTELASIRVDLIRESFSTAGADVGKDDWTVHVNYSNLCDRQWQRRQGEALLAEDGLPEILRTQLPRRLLSARHGSNRLTAPSAD